MFDGTKEQKKLITMNAEDFVMKMHNYWHDLELELVNKFCTEF